MSIFSKTYKINNPYKDGHIMDLNLMQMHEYRRGGITAGAIMFCAVPLVVAALMMVAPHAGDLEFMALCQNIKGGDVCHIALR